MFNEKKRHFKKRLTGSRLAQYDLEFQKFKSKEIREGFRFEHDKIVEQAEIIKFEANLIRTFGFDVAMQLKKLNPDDAHNSIRGEEERKNLAPKLGFEPKVIGKLSELDKKILENLEKKLEPLEKDIEQLRGQIDKIDGEINMLTDKISSVAELEKMLTSYINNL